MTNFSPRERVNKALNHEEPDRIPNDFGGTIVSSIHLEPYKELTDYLQLDPGGLGIRDHVQQLPFLTEDFREYFQVDFVPLSANPPADWKLEIEENKDAYTYVDEWGTTMRMPKSGGHYFDYWEFPVTGDLNELKSYDWPNPDDPARTEGLREEAFNLREEKDYAICGSPLFGGGILEQAERIIGLSQFLTLLLKDSEAAEYILDRLTDIYKKSAANFLGEVGDLIDVVLYWDDVGTQDSLLISPETYREMIKPRQRELFDTIKSCTDAKIFYHTDGAIWRLIPDLIEIGVDILQPIQVNSGRMGETKELKREFGDDIVFWGASCDSQKVLPYGTPEDVRRETKRRINDLKDGGGYVFSPIHNVQPGVPPENIEAMYETFFELRDY
ncbi:uroporphyrinogen-III decarboxylase [Candidatus Bipolaricaulota bacterium]|nr:uroporphyrinogen-III decarboxylase [Candidatus Bipolaricaulota bacterium]